MTPVPSARPFAHPLAAAALFATCVGASSIGLAQAPRPAPPGGAVTAGGTSMAQGEAAIQTRTDVRFTLESAPGTSSNALSELASAAAPLSGDARRCYAAVAAERPTVEGTVRARLERGTRGRLSHEFVEDTAGDRELTRCLERAIKQLRAPAGTEPMAAIVRLEFASAAAAGVRRTERATAAEAQVRVEHVADGALRVSGGTLERNLLFSITSAGADEAAMQALHGAVRTAFPPLLDCRRRAARRGMSPEGKLEVDLPVGRGAPRTVESTLADRNAGRCVERALRSLPARRARARLTLELAALSAAERPAESPR